MLEGTLGLGHHPVSTTMELFRITSLRIVFFFFLS